MAFGSIWKFGADNSEYKKAVREMPSELDKSARQIEQRTQQMGAKMSGAMRDLQGILAGGMALAGLKNLMNDFDKVAKVATRFGASAEEIQRVSVAADLAGTSIDTVARVLTKMAVAASDASNGNQAMAEAFAKAGLNAQQFKNAGLDQQLILLSEAFNRARGDADATNQIIELMGTRAASQMIPLIDNTAALRAEMEAVSVASDDVVRKIEAANDRMTRLGNSAKVFFADLLQFITDSSERIGSMLAQGDGLMRLVNALANALRGNFIPLTQVLATSKTIAEMEQIEARASAIAQLTREGALGMNADQNAALIEERTKQILENLRGTNRQIQIAEDTTDRVVSLEKEKTQELSRQSDILEQQENRRRGAVRSMEREIALIEAKLSGNKELEASLKEQADFEDALARGADFETAANLAASRASERAAAAAASQPAAPTLSGGGFSEAVKTRAQRIAELRAQAAAERASRRIPEFIEKGAFGAAAAAEERAAQASQRILDRQRAAEAATGQHGGNNMGEAYRNFKDKMARGGIYDTTSQAQFEEMIKQQSKTEKERLLADEPSRQGAKQKTEDPMSTMAGDIKAIKEVLTRSDGIHDRLPIRVLAA